MAWVSTRSGSAGTTASWSRWVPTAACSSGGTGTSRASASSPRTAPTRRRSGWRAGGTRRPFARALPRQVGEGARAVVTHSPSPRRRRGTARRCCVRCRHGCAPSRQAWPRQRALMVALLVALLVVVLLLLPVLLVVVVAQGRRRHHLTRRSRWLGCTATAGTTVDRTCASLQRARPSIRARAWSCWRASPPKAASGGSASSRSIPTTCSAWRARRTALSSPRGKRPLRRAARGARRRFWCGRRAACAWSLGWWGCTSTQ